MISLLGGAMRVMRGYEVFQEHVAASEIEFLGGHDGPQLQIRWGNGSAVVLQVEMVPALIQALQLALVPPVARPGEHDEEIRQMGFQRLPMRC